MLFHCLTNVADSGPTLDPGLPTVLAEPAALPDEFYTDQHVKGVIRLSVRW